MGIGYTNVAEVVSQLAGPAFVAPDGDCVVVFAEADDEGLVVGPVIAAALGCVAATVEVFGEEHAEFMEPYSPIDPQELVHAVGRGNVETARAILGRDFVLRSSCTGISPPRWVCRLETGWSQA